MPDNSAELPPDRPGPDELLKQLNEQPVSEIFAVVGPGPGAGGGGRGELWTFTVGLSAWKPAGGTVRTRELVVRKLVPESELDNLIGLFNPYQVLHLRARVAEHSLFDRPDALLIEIIGEHTDDHELNRIAQQLQLPVILDSADFGQFTLNRRLNWFEAETNWGSLPVRLHLWTGEIEEATGLIDFARSLWEVQPIWDERIKNFAVTKLLSLKNDSWLQEDEKELTTEDFKQRMTLESITVSTEGDLEFWFDDGDLFWGHSITVEANLTEGPTDAGIHG